jgi:hypothetical protein
LGSLDGVSEDILEVIDLRLRDLLNSLGNQPLDGTVARRSGGRAHVRVETAAASHGTVQVTGSSGVDEATVVVGTSGRAASNSNIRVFSEAVVAFFTEGGIDDSITTEGELAVFTASEESGSEGSVVTFFVEVNIAISTNWNLAVQLA